MSDESPQTNNDSPQTNDESPQTNNDSPQTNDESPQTNDESPQTNDESTSGETTTDAAPAALDTNATAFDNITSAMQIMANPLGIAGLAKELAESVDKIVVAAQTAPTTLGVVAAAEVQRLSMLLVKHQIDNFKVFPDISRQITAILTAFSKSDSTGLLASSQALLSLAPSTSAVATVDISSTLITNVLNNPLLTTNLKQLNDITDQINAALVDSEIIRFNDNMLKLSSTLFPLLVANKQQ
jgi:hypothetical protein